MARLPLAACLLIGACLGVAAGTANSAFAADEPAQTDAAPQIGGATEADNKLTAAEAEAGWELLFNGKDLSSFMPDPKREYHKWYVDNGVITLVPAQLPADPRYEVWPLWSVAEFSDYVLKFDFHTGPNPDAGHSAVVIRAVDGPPQTTRRRALDVGLYGPARKLGHFTTGAFRFMIKPPTKHAMHEAGQWNTMQITAKGNLVSVELNGELVNELNLDDYTEPNKRPDGTAHVLPLALKDLPRTSRIAFRDDCGIQVWLKNIKIRQLAEADPLPEPLAKADFATATKALDIAAAADIPPYEVQLPTDNQLTDAEIAEGYQLLFNGYNFEGFRQVTANGFGKWIVEGGVIRNSLFGGKAKYVAPGNLYTQQEFENYILKLDFRVPPKGKKGTHSGILLRNLVDAKTGKPGFDVLEVDIRGVGYGNLSNCTGSLRMLGVPTSQRILREDGDWNQAVITVNGPHIQAEINGVVVSQADLDQYTTIGVGPTGDEIPLKRVAGKDIPRSSHVGFRDDHGSPVWFKNIKLKPLP